MPVPDPTNRSEADLLSSFTFSFMDARENIVAYSDGGLSNGPGPKGYGLLLALDDGVWFYIDWDKSLAATWNQITGVTFKKKLLGHSIRISTTVAGVLDFRVTSATLGQQIHDLWRANR